MFGLMLSLFLANLDQTIVATCLPAMARDLNGWDLLPWIVSAYLITSTATTPIYGRLSDLFGRRATLLTSIAIFAGASIFCALARTMPELVAARVLQGVGGGGLRSIAQIVIADIIPPRERGRYQGYMSTTFLVSTTLGPVLGGLFAEYLSWPWIFWINAPLGALAFGVIGQQLKSLPKPTRKPNIDWLGALLILLSAVPLMLGLSNVERTGGWRSVDVLAPILFGLVATAALILVELRVNHPMLPVRLFSNRTFSISNVALFLPSMAMTAMVIIVPLDYQLVLRWTADEAGLQLIALTGGMAIGSFVAGSLVSRLGRARVFPIIGGGTTVLVCVLVAVFGLGQSTLFDVVTTFLLGAGFGWQINPNLVIAQNALEPEEIASGVAGMTFLRSLAGAFGVAMFTTFLIGRLASGGVAGAKSGADVLRAGANADLSSEALARLTEVMQHGFSAVFLLAGVISAIGLAAAIAVDEKPLRTSKRWR